MKKLALIIDTTIYGAAVGLNVKGSKSLCFFESTSTQIESARQLPLIVDQGLKSINACVEDVDTLVVSKGPGSFTGIRMGLAYAYGLYFSRKNVSSMTLAGHSSLETLAQFIAKNETRDVSLFLPATKMTGYVANVKDGKCELHAIDMAQVDLSLSISDSAYVIGDWKVLVEYLVAKKKNEIQYLNYEVACRRAVESMAFYNGILPFGGIQELPEAIYLRKSSVEENAEKNQKLI